MRRNLIPYLPAFSLLSTVACTGQDTQLTQSTAEMAISPTTMDFGEVVVGFATTLGVAVTNDGYGELGFTEVSLDGLTSSDFELVGWPEGLGHGESGELLVKFTPTGEGQDYGNVELLSNDEANPDFLLPLSGTGVEPEIDVDPETLAFGIIPAGTTATQAVSIGAVGSGDLKIFSITVIGDGAPYYSLQAPTEYVEPYTVPNGFSLNLDVTFAPVDDLEQNALIEIASNDPRQPLALVALYGNTLDNPDTNTAPDVEIVGPNNGQYFLDNESAPLSGHVVDPDDDVTTLLCGWYANGSAVAAGFPDADGNLSNEAVLPAGDTTVTLRCIDAAGDRGEDSVVLTVWESDEPMQYVLSGGATAFDFISVDDDLTVYLNGTAIYTDSDNTKTNLPPFAFDAAVGDEIRVVATDDNACDAFLDTLYLHWGTGSSQALNDTEVCKTSCADHACYDGTYAGPWPGVFSDQTYTIEIP